MAFDENNMPQLVIKSPDGASEIFIISQLRTRIGRSDRNDVCLSDDFASRLHAEVRREGDRYWLQDLGSANGTLYNGTIVSTPTPIIFGGEIEIGKTLIIFEDEKVESLKTASLIAEIPQALDPSTTISLSRKKNTTAEILKPQLSNRDDLIGLISKVGAALLSSKSLKDTLNQIVSLVFESVPADRCLIMLRDENKKDLMKIAVARERDKNVTPNEVKISRTIIKEVLVKGKSILTSNVRQDPKFVNQTISLLGVNGILAVPLSAGESKIFGMIYADTPTYENKFTEEHLNILTTLASVASIRVENATLTEEHIKRERMERELELATEIQQRFHPSETPKINGYELQGISFACYEIGGDYYDFIPKHDGKMLIALGDVSGKGAAAALLMSSLHAAIHAQTDTRSSLAEMVASVNKYLTNNTPANRFITFFVTELDSENGILSYINAGHNPPLIARKDGQVEKLVSSSFPLGIMSTAKFVSEKTKLEMGEVLVVFSDGVSEAADMKGEEYGIDRLSEVIRNNAEKSASELRDKIESSISSFTKNSPATDDITLVIVKRT